MKIHANIQDAGRTESQEEAFAQYTLELRAMENPSANTRSNVNLEVEWMKKIELAVRVS